MHSSRFDVSENLFASDCLFDVSSFSVVCMIISSVYSNVLFSSVCRFKTWLAFPGISQMVAYCWETAVITHWIQQALVWIVVVRTRQLYLVANVHKYTFLEYDIKYLAAISPPN